MRRRTVFACVAIGLLITAGPVSAATVRFTLVPAADNAATQVRVTPGAEVPYQVYVQVTSDTPSIPDNNGLAFFTFVIDTDLGVQQRPLDAFSTLVGQAFPIVQGLGTVRDDDILEIGGGQNTFAGGAVTSGVGVGQAQLIGSGRFITPTTPGLYTVKIRDGATANVFASGSIASARPGTISLGPGFTIVAANSVTPPDDNTDDDTDDDDETPTTQPTTQPTVVSGAALSTGALFAGGIILVALVALLFAGPLAGMLALLLFPLLGLLLLAGL